MSVVRRGTIVYNRVTVAEKGELQYLQMFLFILGETPKMFYI